MLFRSGRSLVELGLAREAISYYEELKRQAEQRLGPDHLSTLTLSNNLACAYEAVGDLGRAIPMFE